MIIKLFKLWRKALVTIILVTLNCYSYAQSSEVEFPLMDGKPLTESQNLFQVTTYPQNWAITRDSNGNLIVGTGGGIAIYDGARWQTADMPGLSVRSVAAAADGRIYVGGASEFGYFKTETDQSVDRLTYHSLIHLVPESYRQFRSVTNIIVRQDSSVIFNGINHSFHYRDGEIKVIGDDVWVFRLFEANQTIFSNDSLGLSIYEDGKLNLIPGAEEFEYTGIYCVQPVNESTILFSVRNQGLFTYNGEQIRSIESDASDFFSRHYPYTCQRLPDGSYIAGTLNAGAVRFNSDGAILGVFNDSGLLPENTVYSSFSDANGTVWLTHLEHISRLDFGLPIRVVNESSGYRGLPMSLIYEDGNITIGTQHGVFRSENSDLLQPEFKEILSASERSFLLKSDSLIYSYTTRKLYTPLISNEPVFNFPAIIDRLFISDAEPSLFYAVNSRGLFPIVKDEGSYKAGSFIAELDLSNAKIVQNSSGDLWIGSSSGSLVYIPFTEIRRFLETGDADIREYEMPEGWRGGGTRMITLVIDNEDVLVGTPRGLYRIDRETDSVVEDNRFGELSRVNEEGAPSSIFHLEKDSYENIWIRSRREYQFAEKQDDGSFTIHKAIPGRIDDNISNAIVPVGNGKAWFLGSKGLIYYDHNQSMEITARPPVIRRVISRSDSVLYQGYSRERSEQTNLELAYELNDFRIEFGFPDFSSFDQTQYEVKLEGFDEEWSAWSTESQKDYTQVREGRYRFLVRARSGTGLVTEAAILPIRIFPPWYRTLWAYLIYVVGISGLLYSIHRYRINKIVEIQQVRNRIASDLHDEVSATLSSITFFTQAIERNRNGDKAAHYLRLISGSAGDAKEKMSDIIWSINPEHDNWETLLSKCKRFAADLLESKNITYDLSFPELNRGKIGIELRQNIWLIFKEIITNIARHSNASHVKISFTFHGSELHILVSDNGEGFNPDDQFNGNGLRNIRKRVIDLGGGSTLSSNKEKGTSWKITLPV